MKARAERRFCPGGLGRRSPALRAVLLGLVVLGRLAADPPPSAAQAGAILEQFRGTIWSQPIYAEFDLHQMPRRGPEKVFHGRFWGTRNAAGPVTRVELAVGPGGFTHHLLLQGGPDAGLWVADGPGAGAPAPQALLAPLVPGVEMIPFDLLPSPYLYWLDANLVAVQRIRGRPAYTYDFTPSADFAAQYPAVRMVRAYLDIQYNALMQSEQVGPAGHIAKTLSLLELRKVGDRWIPKDLDVRSEATRNKTRLSLTAVAIGPEAVPGDLTPGALGDPLAPPAPARVQRVDP